MSSNSNEKEIKASDRPTIFKTTTNEIFAVITCSLAIFLCTLGNGYIILTLTDLGQEFQLDPSMLNWVISGFSLASGATFLTMSQIADNFGRRRLLLLGIIWLLIWCLAAGFATNYAFLVTCRALQGVAIGASQPSAIGILGALYPRPCDRRNRVFSTISAANPLGYVFGLILGGIAVELLNWKWSFWIMSILCAIEALLILAFVPSDTRLGQMPNRHSIKNVDFIGSFFSLAGFLLMVLAFIQAPSSGWNTPWILFCLIFGMVLTGIFIFVESKVSHPMLPLQLFKNRQFCLICIILFLCYGCFGIFPVYCTQTFQVLQKSSAFATVAKFLPMVISGLITNFIAAFTIGKIPGHLLLIFASICFIICPVLFQYASSNTSYWAMHFPALVIIVWGADYLFPVALVYIQGCLSSDMQSLGGAVINTITQLGITIATAVAATVQGTVYSSSSDLVKSFRAAMLFASCLAIPAFFIALPLRMKTANHTHDNKFSRPTQSREVT